MHQVRPTSVLAYNIINKEGLIEGFQLDVYNIIYNHGPLTAGEIATFYRDLKPNSVRGRNECAKRVSELLQMGVVYDTGKLAKCPATGHTVILWDVNSELPKKRKDAVKQKCPHCDGTGKIEKEEPKTLITEQKSWF